MYHNVEKNKRRVYGGLLEDSAGETDENSNMS